MERALAIILTAGALVWSAILLAAPAGLTSRDPRIATAAAAVYSGAGLICHQRAERSFHRHGVQLPVCARCAGLYFSGAAGALVAWIASRRTRAAGSVRTLLLLSALPTIVTVAVEVAGLASPSNRMRAVSALPLGAAAAWTFVQSLRAEAARSRETGGAAAARGDAL